MSHTPPQEFTKRSCSNLKQIILAVCFLGLFTSGNSQNSILWTESQGSTSLPGKTYCATDLIGNIYIASSVNGTALDWVVASYRPDSVLRWTYNYSGTANLNDVVTGIVVDSTFNIYISGTTEETSTDITLVKLDSAGTKIWAISYDSGGEDVDLSSGIVEYDEYIYLSGASYKPATGYNYRVVKYSKAGNLVWENEFNGNGNDDDFISDIDVDATGNVYVTGRATVTGGSADILTLKYNSSGTLAWSKYFGLIAGQNDFGTALSTSDDGHVYVVGQSFISYTSDLVTIRYNAANGNQKWVARYNGTYNGMDLAADVIALSGAIYVVGTSEAGADNRNFVTLSYNPGGKVKWMQIYNGPVNGNDECRTLIEDGEDIVVSGRSEGAKNYDVTTISYEKQHGTINWTIRYDAVFEEEEDVWSIARDEMGNLLLGSFAQNGVFTHEALLLKINQLDKNNAQVRSHLEMLGFGVLGLASDTASKRVLYDLGKLVVDSFYQVGFNKYLNACDLKGVGTRALVRGTLVAKYNLSSSMAWEVILSRRIYIEERSRPSMIFLPKFETFSRVEFIDATSSICFSHGEEDYPIPSLPNYSSVFEEDFVQPTIVLVAQPAPWWKKFEPSLRYCFATMPEDPALRCSVCGGIQPFDGLPMVTPCPGNQAHEVGLAVGYDYHSNCLVAGGSEACVEITDLSQQGPIANDFYAYLQAMPGYTYYERIGVTSDYSIRKIPLPILDIQNNSYGTSMTICALNGDHRLEMHDIHSPPAYTFDFAIAAGGVYKMTRPGTNLRPLYFAYPVTQFLRFSEGPDMNLFYGANDMQATCLDGSREIEENYFIGGCEICDATSYVFGFTQNHTADILATTDYSTISQYWQDNAITVGFDTDGTWIENGNHVTFYAGSVATGCEIGPTGPLVASFTLSSNEQYQVGQYLSSPGPYNAGSIFLVHVRGRFVNGEVIDDCQLVTLVSGQIVHAVVEIRGNINDYSPVFNNYQVDIYEAP